MAKVSELEQFAQNFCSRYCLTCPDNCCNGTRHLINISKYDKKTVQLFLSRQVPLFEKESLDRDSAIYWLCKGTMSAYQEFLNRQRNPKNRQINPAHFTGDILLSDKTKVPIPALIEMPLVSVINRQLTTNNMYYYMVYTDKFCPLYKENKGCTEHENPNRPIGCKSYPFQIKPEYDDEVSKIGLMESCYHLQEAVNELLKKFEELDFFQVT